jgi:hypothetical protein
MRKTLLIAAAALAASIISSQAQVYSLNIVGYANVPIANGARALLAIPFNIGSSNGANEIWPLNGVTPTVPDGSSLLIWDSVAGKYTTYLSDSGNPPFLWDNNNGDPLSFSPKIPVGEGFFLIPSADTTNTFAGTVSVNVGTSNSATLGNGVRNLVGLAVPYAGAITNGVLATGVGGACLWNDGTIGIPEGSSFLQWDSVAGKYTTYLSDSGSPSRWDNNNGDPILAPPSVKVAEGFFVIPTANFNWVVGL